MIEHPIIFSTPMVKAILNGKKKQTRRIINPKMVPLVKNVLEINKVWSFDMFDGLIFSPYGYPGDQLWVRETFDDGCMGGAIYKADYSTAELIQANNIIKWKPSIHMPRWASRITLEIINVRAEQIRDITLKDVKSEGIGAFTFAKGVLSDDPPDPRWKFMYLWNSINAIRGFGWASNPWVWVIEFKVIKPAPGSPVQSAASTIPPE